MSSEGSEKRSAYPPVARIPTQEAHYGVRFDFNHGARVLLPEGIWRVLIRDLGTGNVLFVREVEESFVSSTKRYFIRFGIEILRDGELIYHHEYDARGQDVAIQFPIGTLGDTLAWFPYAVRFAEKHGCRLTCAMSSLIIPLLSPAYPEIRFVSHDEFVERELADKVYATYSLGLFFDDKDFIWQPTDFRLVGLHKTAAYILGVETEEQQPTIELDDTSRPIDEPYVCIGVQSSTQCKYWNNPNGWPETIKFLRKAGYRVVCIDQKPVHGTGIVHNHVPHGVEDETGDRPLVERARWLTHAAFFIGLSSGLSWLAWACRTPVVMISGFTHPVTEFASPYRVINWHACNSCWNDPTLRFDHTNFLWCPRHAGTSRQFECSRLITAAQVRAVISSIPGFGEHSGSHGSEISRLHRSRACRNED